jgi:hypothetical protein
MFGRYAWKREFGGRVKGELLEKFDLRVSHVNGY